MAVGPESYGRICMSTCTVGSAGRGGCALTATTRVLVAIIAVAVLSLPSLAQSTAGRTLGTVTDQSGAAVAGATVVVTDVERGTSRALTTDEAGAYVAADRQPGTYKIRVESKGFKPVERLNVVIKFATDVLPVFHLQAANNG